MNRSVRIYSVAVLAAFWLAELAALASGLGHVPRHLALLAPILGLAVAIEALVVRMEDSSISFSATAHIAAAILFGPVVAGLIAACAVIVVDGVRMAPRRYVAINSAMFGSAILIAGTAFELAGGHPGSVNGGEILPLLVLIVTRMAANELILSGAVAAASGRRPTLVLLDGVRDALPSGVAEGCLGVLVAFGYRGDRWIMLPFLVPLLVLLYHANVSFERLRRETGDALNAFAGVVDERDASTAQHSRRVATYVEQFCEAIGLGEREHERLVAAARFHDLGKVTVDVATLSKSERLTDAELRAIRSHPRLSARLLAPFHFAREMALYAELHHERYDGRGYYHVPQREIPVEAHVLIVADSFDAMTSARAYRPALTGAEAVHELRDKAGAQFHPVVAHAFAAMVEGRDIEAAIGAGQLAALRAEFSRVPVVEAGLLRQVARARPLAVLLASSALVAAGLPSAPTSLALALGATAGLVALWSAANGMRDQRRLERAVAVIDGGGDAEQAVRAAGVDAWAAWLVWDAVSERYGVHATQECGASVAELEEVCLRALRPGGEAVMGEISSGTFVVLTGTAGDSERLAVGSDRLTGADVPLIQRVAQRCAETDGASGRALAPVAGDTRSSGRSSSRAVVLIDLGAFENVRGVAGQLSAERVVADARARLEGLLRAGDTVVQMGEDRLGVLLEVVDQEQLDALCGRMRSALAEVSVPRRAMQIRPRLRAALGAAALAHPELAALAARAENGEGPAGQLRAAG